MWLKERPTFKSAVGSYLFLIPGIQSTLNPMLNIGRVLPQIALCTVVMERPEDESEDETTWLELVSDEEYNQMPQQLQ